jgi:hypothetical protein
MPQLRAKYRETARQEDQPSWQYSSRPMREWVLARKMPVLLVWCFCIALSWGIVLVNRTAGAVLTVALAAIGVVLWVWINHDSDHPTSLPPPGATS